MGNLKAVGIARYCGKRNESELKTFLYIRIDAETFGNLSCFYSSSRCESVVFVSNFKANRTGAYARVGGLGLNHPCA